MVGWYGMSVTESRPIVRSILVPLTIDTTVWVAFGPKENRLHELLFSLSCPLLGPYIYIHTYIHRYINCNQNCSSIIYLYMIININFNLLYILYYCTVNWIWLMFKCYNFYVTMLKTYSIWYFMHLLSESNVHFNY